MTERAHTVILVRPTATGGLLAHMREEARLLREAGARVIDVGPPEGRLDAQVSVSAPISAAASPRKALVAVGALRRVLHDALQESPEVVVHAHGVRAGALSALALSTSRGPARTLPLVTTLHNAPPSARTAAVLSHLLHAAACLRSSCVLAVSPDLQDLAWRHGARRVVRAIIPAPEHADDSRGPGEREAPAAARPDLEVGPYVLVLARLSAQKGLDVLLDAVGRLREDNLPTVLIAGEGPLRAHLQQRIRTEQLDVRLLGQRGDVPGLLAQALLVIQPSLWEGQPVAIQEALRAHKAIIATNAGGTRWVTQQAAHLVPPNDPAALAAAIHALVSAPGAATARARLEQAAAHRATTLPTADHLAAQLSRVLTAPRP